MVLGSWFAESACNKMLRYEIFFIIEGFLGSALDIKLG